MRKGNARKTPWSRPLADFVHTAIDPVVARQGFGQSGLILFWDAIVGERLAAISQPVKMQWPARGRDRAADNGAATATLIIRVESGFALEMQHLAPIIIERINAHFGWRSVSRIQLKQGPLAARFDAARRPRAHRLLNHGLMRETSVLSGFTPQSDKSVSRETFWSD